MADPDKGGSTPPSEEKPKELTMEKRLILAFILMGAVLFTTPYIFKSAAPPPMKQVQTKSPKTGEAAPPAPAAEAVKPEAAAETPAAPEAAPVQTAAKEDLFTIDT